MFREQNAKQIKQERDRMNMTNRVLQQRGDTNHGIACIKWKLPVGNQEVAAINENIERMGTATSIACATDFVIDMAVFFMIKGGDCYQRLPGGGAWWTVSHCQYFEMQVISRGSP